jgi:hypothetical protein
LGRQRRILLPAWVCIWIDAAYGVQNTLTRLHAPASIAVQTIISKQRSFTMKTIFVSAFLMAFTTGSGFAGSNAGMPLPEGARFVTCINGGALYISKNRDLFQIGNDLHCAN